jgi:transposase
MEKKFDAMTFLSFLQRLLRYHRPGRKMIIILDNARWHHAKLLRPWLKMHRRMIQLIFLPPYSPEMNHAERVWKLTRTLCTHNRYFAKLEELVETVSTQFKAWDKPNDTLRRLCAII